MRRDPTPSKGWQSANKSSSARGSGPLLPITKLCRPLAPERSETAPDQAQLIVERLT
jgi:hypothetical protein